MDNTVLPAAHTFNPQVERVTHALTSQPQNVSGTVIISHPAEGRRLSWIE